MRPTGILNVTHQGAARHAASVHFRPSTCITGTNRTAGFDTLSVRVSSAQKTKCRCPVFCTVLQYCPVFCTLLQYCPVFCTLLQCYPVFFILCFSVVLCFVLCFSIVLCFVLCFSTCVFCALTHCVCVCFVSVQRTC